MKLFENEKDCCGCGACFNICPKKAISMIEDQYGFIYPRINNELCIDCGMCKRVCSYQNKNENNFPISTFAAVTKNEQILKKSASGGVFTTLALQMLEENGVVFGAAFDNSWNLSHTMIDNPESLYKLQGSKYTHSSTGSSYSLVRSYLENGIKVLYSGTPCQIAGLYGFLGKDYENLITVDLICHGVPSNKMFQEYIKHLEKNENGKVINFTFRDKSIGWGKNGSADIKRNEKVYFKKLWESESSYFYYFSKNLLFRENCYSCKYASSNRPGDITLGDYWGIERSHPEYLKKNGFVEKSGISVIIANTQRGLNYIKLNHSILNLKESEFKKASSYNSRLNYPANPGNRKNLLRIYDEEGWSGLENNFDKSVGLKKYISPVKSLIPQRIKRILKKIK